VAAKLAAALSAKSPNNTRPPTRRACLFGLLGWRFLPLDRLNMDDTPLSAAGVE